MDNFDLREYLQNNPLLQEEEFLFEVSDEEAQKAAAKALGISPEEVETEEPKEGEINESVTLAITIAGLIPPALELVGNITNKAKAKYGLSDKEKEIYQDYQEKIKKKKELIKKLDDRDDPREEKEKELLHDLEEKRDKQFGTKIGNWAKHAGHSLHKAYTYPIRKMLQFAGWTAKLAGKKTKLQDEKYREKLSNIIYAVVMIGIAGYGVASHIGHLSGVGPVLTTILDGVKGGKSVIDTIKSVATLI